MEDFGGITVPIVGTVPENAELFWFGEPVPSHGEKALTSNVLVAVRD